MSEARENRSSGCGTCSDSAGGACARSGAGCPRPRLWLWMTGLVLWVAVGVAATILLLNRPPEDGPVEIRRSPAGAISETSLASSELPGGTGNQPADNEPQGVWDPDGVADFEFTECRGGTVSKKDLLGKPWLASFIFTRCAGTCPRITASMRELQRDLRDADVRFVSFTVDPEFDTPEVLRKYAEEHRAEEGRWLFLTGDQGATYQLIWKSFKLPVKEITGPERTPGFEILHSNNIMLVDERGVVVGKYDGTNEVEVARLRRRVREMLRPAEGGRE